MSDMLMKEIMLTMKVKNFIHTNDTSLIKYGHDGGHAYSYIDSSIVDELTYYAKQKGNPVDWYVTKE